MFLLSSWFDYNRNALEKKIIYAQKPNADFLYVTFWYISPRFYRFRIVPKKFYLAATEALLSEEILGNQTPVDILLLFRILNELAYSLLSTRYLHASQTKAEIGYGTLTPLKT